MAKPKFKVVPISEARGEEFLERTVRINRSAVVVKGGRRFSFSALSVVGNRDGLVGIGYGKAKEVPSAVEKSFKDGRKNLVRIARKGSTIPHTTEACYGASRVRLVPAAPGTGIIAGNVVRQVIELAGITDILTKAYDSTNPVNLTKATLAALCSLRDQKHIEGLRGVKTLASATAPRTPPAEPAAASSTT